MFVIRKEHINPVPPHPPAWVFGVGLTTLHLKNINMLRTESRIWTHGHNNKQIILISDTVKIFGNESNKPNLIEEEIKRRSNSGVACYHSVKNLVFLFAVKNVTIEV
jgi:hypothetical protein